MTVEIDRLTTEVEVLPQRAAATPSGGGGANSPAAPSAQGNAAAKEALRPLVMELLAEEIEHYMRLRG